MFDSDKTSAVLAVRELASLYEKDSGNSSLIKKQVHGDAAATTAASSGEYISRADYVKQLKDAHDKNDTHRINQLRAQRKNSMKQ